MVVFPKAKINLGLRITEKRNDGYHNIETLFYPVSLCDALEFVASSDRRGKDFLTVTGIPLGISSGENIITKALSMIREKYRIPYLKIHLHKAIPNGAGLGGGSSDAACLLKSVNRHFGLSIDGGDLKAMALAIGSDCPFFLDSDPAFARGRGELLEPISPILSGYYLILINPGVGISTREAYLACRPEIPSSSLLGLASGEITDWKNSIFNDFEAFAFRKHPVIGKLKEALYKSGALFSLMSGSGSAVYGIFVKKPARMPVFLKEKVIWEGLL